MRDWNPDKLSYTPTGQQCPPFKLNGVLQPGTDLHLGDLHWQVHAAPGHDPHSVILFEPVSRTLLSADALWQRGFGVVFPELDGEDGFDAVAATLDVIEALQPVIVVPGHGAPFTDVAQALAFARARLEGFIANPAKHLAHAAKVLLKFKLLDAQRMTQHELLTWAQGTPYLTRLFALHATGLPVAQVLVLLVRDLVRAGAATLDGDVLHNA